MDLFPDSEKYRALEAILFSACGPLGVTELSNCLEVTAEETRDLLEFMAEQYNSRGFKLRKIAGGWQFLTEEEMYPYLERLYEPRVRRLSKAAMETLAIVAFCQPVTRGEIEEIRGVNADSIVSNLLEKGFIEEKGRKDTPGKPILYGTGEHFLEMLGIDNLEQLRTQLQ